ncbi:ParD-like family protein [Gilvimarinus sp. DA14]|uniref:ParD-like family protein n=1 Tax=Gilvimarinus sp. DA14 TaxID=2956798 RepID=UPI0020B746FC|nr:ParD-like family protein [Gilvimarinus sp. DA14]UTF61104.1 ParD-like family protein [Gilvimarinus sp. DA14]
MGIVKISDELHDELRRTSRVMERSINAQAEFWLKIGRLAEQHQHLSFAELIQQSLKEARARE